MFVVDISGNMYGTKLFYWQTGIFPLYFGQLLAPFYEVRPPVTSWFINPYKPINYIYIYINIYIMI